MRMHVEANPKSRWDPEFMEETLSDIYESIEDVTRSRKKRAEHVTHLWAAPDQRITITIVKEQVR